jgi:formate dehydrogenase maturation protein FdhE
MNAWRNPHCPFCGAMPAMAEIDRGNVRYLFCPNCFAQYGFKRHHCPACGAGRLEVMQMDAWPDLLIESCPECSGYLKTWSRGAGPPPCPFPYLDIVTRHVDEAAQHQNLKRISIGVMGV